MLNKKGNHVKIFLPRSSSGYLYWIENQYVMVNIYLKKVKKKSEYSLHDASILWTLKSYFVWTSNLLKSMSFRGLCPLEPLTRLCPGPTRGLKRPQTPRRSFAYISEGSRYACDKYMIFNDASQHPSFNASDDKSILLKEETDFIEPQLL